MLLRKYGTAVAKLNAKSIDKFAYFDKRLIPSQLLSVNLDELQTNLERRENLIADREFYQRDPEGHLQALVTVSESLENWEAENATALDPVLKHYLERRSYSKALAYCKGDTEHRI